MTARVNDTRGAPKGFRLSASVVLLSVLTYVDDLWTVLFDDLFAAEFERLERRVQLAIVSYAEALAQVGPSLGRPHADTLKGSRFGHMKELRPTVNKVEWRVAFAFDPRRNAILLAAVAKGGSKTAYRRLIKVADERYADHIASLGEE